MSDLAAYRVGVVQDYVNNYQLDRNIAEDRQRFDPAPDDGRNLLKLASGSIDLAVIDQNVFHYLLRHDSLVRHIGQRLEMNPRLLETKTLHVCFKPGRGRRTPNRHCQPRPENPAPRRPLSQAPRERAAWPGTSLTPP